MAASRYWRVYFTSYALIAKYATVELRVGGVNIALPAFGGSAFASSSSGGTPAANAFDGNSSSTFWASAGGCPGQFIGWDFGAGNTADVQAVRIVTSDLGSSYHPTDCVIQRSDNGTDYTTVVTVTGMAQTAATTIDITIPASATVAANLPALSFAAQPGSEAALPLPKLSLSSSVGSKVALGLPTLNVYAAAHDSTGENEARLTLPAIRAQAHSGAQVAVNAPTISVAVRGTVTTLGNANLTLPALTTDSRGAVALVARVAASLPALSFTMRAGGHIDAAIPSIMTRATAVVGGVAQITATLRGLVMDGSAEVGTTASITATLPSIIRQPYVTAAITLPSLFGSAAGGGISAVTYEAYALNLGHIATRAGVQEKTNEVTRYTNYGFTQIFRLRDKYYGVSPAGLFLLEGDTDDGDPINYSWKTHASDFGSPYLKTVISAYFRGRLGESSTVTLYTQDVSLVSYDFTTPRGVAAQNHRQIFGRGVKANYIAIGGAGETKILLNAITLETTVLSRRI